MIAPPFIGGLYGIRIISKYIMCNELVAVPCDFIRVRLDLFCIRGTRGKRGERVRWSIWYVIPKNNTTGTKSLKLCISIFILSSVIMDI